MLMIKAIGIVELHTILLIQLATPDEWIGFATGTPGLLRSMGGSTGTAIYTAIYSSKAKTLVLEYLGKAAIAAGLPQSSLPELLGVLTGTVMDKNPMDIPGVTPAILGVAETALKKAYIKSFRYVWLFSIAFGGLVLLCVGDEGCKLTALILSVMKRKESADDYIAFLEIDEPYCSASSEWDTA